MVELHTPVGYVKTAYHTIKLFAGSTLIILALFTLKSVSHFLSARRNANVDLLAK